MEHLCADHVASKIDLTKKMETIVQNSCITTENAKIATPGENHVKTSILTI